MRATILVTGANGQLGREIRELETAFPQFHFVFLSREEMAVHDPVLVRQCFDTYKPDYCINCAAYTAVDKAETETDMAYQVNAEAAGVLAEICASQNCRFIHISTDYVFDGQGTRPYLPDDPTGPRSVYGASKLAGEQQVQSRNPDAIIIRTSWVYSGFGKNFVKTMLRLMTEKPEINVVNDQWGSPTYAADLAAAIMVVVAGNNWKAGVYHFCNAGAINWHQFATAIRDLAGLSAIVHAIPSSAYPVAAERPKYSVLDTRSMAETFAIPMKPWAESLQHCLSRLAKNC